MSFVVCLKEFIGFFPVNRTKYNYFVFLTTFYWIFQTTLYTEDWIGLKKLDEAGKVKFFNASGGHLQITYGEMEKYILPYLVQNATLERLSDSLALSSEHEGKIVNLYASHWRNYYYYFFKGIWLMYE